jgi:CRP-like cAMP-binding protein
MTLQVLEPYETLHALPAGKVLFREAEQAEGVYVLHSGDVELSFSNKPMHLSAPGEILGLTTVMSGRAHDSSAVSRTPCVVGFVEKSVFLRLLDEQPSLWLTVLQMISSNISHCWQSMRAMATR